MTEARWATAEDRHDVIDFCNFVFSKDHRPHDFATLLPKLYGENSDTMPDHFILLDGKRIVAAVLALPRKMRIGEACLPFIGVGTVCVHPRYRGRGYMSILMEAVDMRAREYNAVFSVLGGRRQRYGHYGYAQGGLSLSGTFTPDNARHCLSVIRCDDMHLEPMSEKHLPDALALHKAQPAFCERSEKEFIDVLRSWNHQPFAIFRNDSFVGYTTLKFRHEGAEIGEMQLISEDYLPSAVKLLSGLYGALELTAAPWQASRAEFITEFCERFAISHDNMYKLYRKEALASAFESIGVNADKSLTMRGFTLPLPLCVPSQDCV